MSSVSSIPVRVHQVLETRWFGANIYEVRVARNGLKFTPGDCVAIFGADGQGSRPYSIASGVNDPFLSFVIRQMPGGEVSGFVAGKKPGEEIQLSPPFGWFRPGETQAQAPFVFVATGTGISPFLSHFRSRPAVPPRQLFYGVRAAEDLVERELLSSAPETYFAVSRAEEPGCFRGRVTALMDRIFLSPDCQYYLCGLDDMIDEVTRFLETRGISLRQIHRECFFNALYE